mmetsp:Transcript_7540/g.11096  ORF Transcript_7540/g.11096 Transcript_7540/m.11096 type:complete len:309 (+) Transcript_7540:2460-3386(+)
MQGLRELASRFAQISKPNFVKVVEMGPRDGLQNESNIVPTATKVEFINRLSECGYKAVEVTSFVSKKWVPQMGDNSEVFSQIQKKPGVSYPVLTPNLKGYEAARSVGAQEVAIFAAASEGFSKKNINCSIEESLDRFQPVMHYAYKDGVKVRGYVSCVMGCPIQGEVDPESVRYVAKRLHEMGCYEISLGDTIGVGTPELTEEMLYSVMHDIPASQLAVHFHNTHGRAIENILTALNRGISVVDSSIASLGGCPYAPGATGNVSTEDVAFVLSELSIETGLDTQKLLETAKWVSEQLGRDNRSIYQLT